MTATKEKLKKEIFDTLDYRHGDFYVGGLARHTIAMMLNSNSEDMYDVIENTAELSELIKVRKYLEPYFDYMTKNPNVKCKKCGCTCAR